MVRHGVFPFHSTTICQFLFKSSLVGCNFSVLKPQFYHSTHRVSHDRQSPPWFGKDILVCITRFISVYHAAFMGMAALPEQECTADLGWLVCEAERFLRDDWGFQPSSRRHAAEREEYSFLAKVRATKADSKFLL